MTCGPPQAACARETISDTPSPVRFRAATRTPPGKRESQRKKLAASVADAAAGRSESRSAGHPGGCARDDLRDAVAREVCTADVYPIALPGIDIRVYIAPQRIVRVKAREVGERSFLRLNACTCGPPPGPAPVMMSAKPSPFTSAAATRTPPLEGGVVRKEAGELGDRPVPRREDADGPARSRVPVMISAMPSPFTSPPATAPRP